MVAFGEFTNIDEWAILRVGITSDLDSMLRVLLNHIVVPLALWLLFILRFEQI